MMSNLSRCEKANFSFFSSHGPFRPISWETYVYIFVKLFGRRQDAYTVFHLYLLPLGVTLTLFFSSLLLSVLLRPKMRSCTNAFLTAMAILDMTCASLKLLYYVVKYHAPVTSEYFNSHPWLCSLLFFCDRSILPRSLHLSTLCVTLAMAVHRYIYVNHPATAKKACKPLVVGLSIGLACVLLTPLHISPLYYLDLPQPYVPTNSTECRLLRNLVDVNKMGHCALRVVKARDMRDHIDNAESIFGFIILLLLIGFTVALLKALRDLHQRRKEKLGRKKSKDTSRASCSLVVVLVVITIIESPGIITEMYQYIVSSQLRRQGILSHKKGDLMRHYLIMEKIDTLLSAWLYPLVFFVFCITSAQFRTEFKRCFSCNHNNNSKSSQHKSSST